MREFLSSHRRRRRLMWAATLALVGGSVAALVVLVGNTAKTQKETFSNAAPQVYHEPKAVRLSRRELVSVHAAAVAWIRTAVRRERVDDSWELTAPSLKAGFTRAEWAEGNIPAPPFPADAPAYAPFKVLFSYENDVALVFALLPQRGHPEYRPQAFTIELVKSGGHWLVSSFTPRGLDGASAAPQTGAERTALARSPAQSALSAAWLLIPAGLLGGILLVPIVLWLREWRRGVRARRMYPPPSSPFS